MKKEKRITGGNFLAFGLYAFLGIQGIELTLLGIESMIYPNSISELTPVQLIIHWIATSIVWGLIAVVLARYAKQHYNFDIWGENQSVPINNWIIAIVLAALCIASNAWSWGTLKILGELEIKNSLMLFTFQYIYYIFEVMLVLSVIAYGQKAGDLWFKKCKIPWGGILAGVTWGLAHALTQGSLFVGLEAMVSAVLYGCIYLLMKKRTIYSYPLILLAFVL